MSEDLNKLHLSVTRLDEDKFVLHVFYNFKARNVVAGLEWHKEEPER